MSKEDPGPGQAGDCVECKVFGEGICLKEFTAFDACFDHVTKTGGDESQCMDKFEAFRKCYATAGSKSVLQRIMESAVKGRSAGG